LPAAARTRVVATQLAAGTLQRFGRLGALIAAASRREPFRKTGARVVEDLVELPRVGVGLLFEQVVEQGAHDLRRARADGRLRIETARQDFEERLAQVVRV